MMPATRATEKTSLLDFVFENQRQSFRAHMNTAARDSDSAGYSFALTSTIGLALFIQMTELCHKYPAFIPVW